MSFAIVEGEPTKKQVILDKVLDELVAETGREEDRYNFGKVLLKCLKDRPNVINSVDGSTGKKYTNGEILEKSLRTARALKAAGIGTGDVVMIIGLNRLELAIPFIAAFLNANLPVNVDVGSTAHELNSFLQITRPKIIFSDALKLQTLQQAVRQSGLRPAIVSIDSENSSGYESLADFMRPFSGDFHSFKSANPSRDDAALLLCTSGSTGLAKVPVLTNYCLLAQLPIFTTSDLLIDESLFPFGTVKNMMILSAQWFAYYSAITVAAVYGFQRLQTPQRPVPQHVLQILRKHKPHTVFLSPSYVSLLLQSPDYRPGDLSCLYTVIVTGAVIAPQMQADLKQAIHPDGVVAYTYGCTELGGGLLQPDERYVPGSIGRHQNILTYKGFYGNEEASKKVLTEDGWFRTGDLVYRSEDGNYFYVDRKKLLITYNNYHIYPNEVEAVVDSIDGVLEVAVCGSDKGPLGVVVPRPGSNLTSQAILDVVAEKLSHYKQLIGGVFFVPALPKTVTGKLDRTKLQKLVNELQK